MRGGIYIREERRGVTGTIRPPCLWPDHPLPPLGLPLYIVCVRCACSCACLQIPANHYKSRLAWFLDYSLNICFTKSCFADLHGKVYRWKGEGREKQERSAIIIFSLFPFTSLTVKKSLHYIHCGLLLFSLL